MFFDFVDGAAGDEKLCELNSTALDQIRLEPKVLRNVEKRNLSKKVLIKDPLNQVEGFLGEGLPENIDFWSKAGLMSQVRHDAAWWINNQSLQTLLVVFGNGEKYFKDETLFPEISKAVYKYNNNFV